MTGIIEYNSPNSNLNSFEGFLKIKKDPKIEHLTNKNFIPRGAILKNTEW